MTYPLLALARGLPHRALGVLPTPLERSSLGCWVKRDDLSGGAGYGGNKVRKLEFLLADAVACGHQAILTMGATGSNHVLATALYARLVGFAETHAVLFPQPPSPEVDARLATLAGLGVKITRVPAKALVPAGAIVRLAAGARLRPYVIGPGGSSPLGTLGYVNAALELAAQLQDAGMLAPARVWVPLGSGGTAAGLMVGFRIARLATRVVVVKVVPAPWITVSATLALASRTAALLAGRGVDVATDFSRADLDVVEDQLGPGYGAATPAARDAVARAGEAGLPADTTYSGKALAAMFATGVTERDLFWVTYSAAQSATRSSNERTT
jgi:D-cysteine desulfhydrase